MQVCIQTYRISFGGAVLLENRSATRPEPELVLNRAADLVELRGWHQGDFHEETSGRVCAAGAIRVAAGGVPYESCEQASSAERAFADCLAAHGLAKPGHCPIEVIGQWNDAEGRTAAEVVATLRAAAGEVA